MLISKDNLSLPLGLILSLLPHEVLANQDSLITSSREISNKTVDLSLKDVLSQLKTGKVELTLGLIVQQIPIYFLRQPIQNDVKIRLPLSEVILRVPQKLIMPSSSRVTIFPGYKSIEPPFKPSDGALHEDTCEILPDLKNSLLSNFENIHSIELTSISQNQPGKNKQVSLQEKIADKIDLTKTSDTKTNLALTHDEETVTQVTANLPKNLSQDLSKITKNNDLNSVTSNKVTSTQSMQLVENKGISDNIPLREAFNPSIKPDTSVESASGGVFSKFNPSATNSFSRDDYSYGFNSEVLLSLKKSSRLALLLGLHSDVILSFNTIVAELAKRPFVKGAVILDSKGNVVAANLPNTLSQDSLGNFCISFLNLANTTASNVGLKFKNELEISIAEWTMYILHAVPHYLVTFHSVMEFTPAVARYIRKIAHAISSERISV